MGESSCMSRAAKERPTLPFAWIVALVACLAMFDAYIPLGVAIGGLYVVPTFLTIFTGGRADALLTSFAGSALTIGVFLFSKPTSGVPLEFVIVNRAISLVAIWATYGGLRYFRQAAGKLRASEELFRSVFQHSDDAIVTSDEEGTIILFNRAAENVFGFSPHDAVGQNVRMLMPEPDRSHHDTYIANYIRTGQPRIMGIGREVEGLRKDGTTFPARLQISQFFLDEKRHFIAIARDITTNRRLEEQVRQKLKMEAIGQLAGGVAHDFNNLLTVITGQTELLLERLPEGDPVREDAQEIGQAAQRAAELTQQLLAFSRKQVLVPTVIDLNAVIGKMERMLRRLIGEDISLVTIEASRLGRVKVDIAQVEQVVMNLAINARHAMPRGGKLTLETQNVELDEAYARTHADVRPGPYVMLAVSDTGVGMATETLTRLFEPFFTTKEIGRGTGLGLATAYGIVKQSGGSISVYSELGHGTTFRIYFPQVEEPLDRTPTRRSAAGVQGTETILLVEDEDAVRRLARRILERNGYTVLDAADGERAIELGKQHEGPIHLLLTDVVMPRMSGRAVAEAITAARPSVKVLYLSGYTVNAVVHNGVLDAGTSLLEKPFTADRLAAKVREVLDASHEDSS